MSELLFRRYLTEPGDTLLEPVGGLELLLRQDQWARDAGLDPAWGCASTLVGVPVPVYPASLPTGHRRWAGLNPAMMWHPLMWLPERQAGRLTINEQIGSAPPRSFVEDGELWAVRVCLELTEAGLYDPDTGAWLDVLGLHGLDIGDPDVVARVDSWLSGSPDVILDAVDLSEHFACTDPDWSVAMAMTLVPELREQSRAIVADELHGLVSEVVQGAEAQQWTGDEVAAGIVTAAVVGESRLGGQFWHTACGLSLEDSWTSQYPDLPRAMLSELKRVQEEAFAR